jgi:hypothetical protein
MGGRKIKFCESYYQLYKEGRGYKKFGESEEREICRRINIRHFNNARPFWNKWFIHSTV